MFARSAASLLIWAVFHISTGYCQTLHVISVADSNDAAIGLGVAANAKALANYVSIVSVITKLSLESTEITGDKFTCTEIMKAVQGIQAKPNDVIIFYYSGHGFAPDHDPNSLSMPAQSIFPWFFCNPPTGRPNLEAIGRELASKGARLTITAADTCNVIIPVPEEPLKARGLIEEHIRAMFLNYRGNILLTSSKRGQFSWYYPTGGVFTSKLLRLLRNPPDAEPQDLWKAIFAKIQEKIMLSFPGGSVVQEPEIPVATNLVFKEER